MCKCVGRRRHATISYLFRLPMMTVVFVATGASLPSPGAMVDPALLDMALRMSLPWAGAFPGSRSEGGRLGCLRRAPSSPEFLHGRRRRSRFAAATIRMSGMYPRQWADRQKQVCAARCCLCVVASGCVS